ncbi:Mu transposase C-terminal domain-containing protein [Phaeobacter inhibens]|uniref:transposase domain-containing protein n=1 Tax=Phaeobacter inhibens TaxID=221822 RepID=UPI0021A3FF34|nr:transposase domain-containing protein [Phaeobacter inhibens]UWR67056.1 Mu transposase C-terminal domain-containing protein [Phaeobacter inhibens]
MTTPVSPKQEWWSVAELAAARLPGIPGTARGVTAKADREGWRDVPGAIKRKVGRGGGLLYHWSVLPLAARTKLIKHDANRPVEKLDRNSAWASYAALPQKSKDEAARRLDAITKVELLHTSGAGHVHAVDTVAAEIGSSTRTIYNWIDLVAGAAPEDRLAFVAPKAPKKRTQQADRAAYQPFMDWLKSAWLRPERPTFAQCYRMSMRQAEQAGWPIPIEKTAKRWVDAEVPRTTQVYLREGVNGLMRCYPAQIRDRSSLHALEAVNADCHKIDVFVEWPDGTVNRPQIVAFQDLYSGKFLSWRVDHDPNKVMVMAAFGELVDNWGIPKRCLFDNGREFANKWMTAGAPTRFRFKVREDDPIGVLPLLGINMHWANPGHGQAKPIERAFRDLASDVAKDVRFAGAYVGNRPDAKPENYGSRAIKAAEFLEVLAEGIAEHNARTGRRSDTAKGRSFDETFAESYATAPIIKATEEQRHLWLMGQADGKLHKDSGKLTLHGNVYHCDWMSQEAGRKVIIRFNPEDLHSGVHLSALDGQYLGFAECQQKVGFFDLDGARSTARRNRQIVKAEKALAELQRPVPVEQLAADMTNSAPLPSEALADLEAKVVKPVFRKPAAVATFRDHMDPAAEREQEALILQMGAKTPAKPEPRNSGFSVANSPEERFRQAEDIAQRQRQGKPVGEAEVGWLEGFLEHAEYKAYSAIFGDFGSNSAG